MSEKSDKDFVKAVTKFRTDGSKDAPTSKQFIKDLNAHIPKPNLPKDKATDSTDKPTRLTQSLRNHAVSDEGYSDSTKTDLVVQAPLTETVFAECKSLYLAGTISDGLMNDIQNLIKQCQPDNSELVAEIDEWVRSDKRGGHPLDEAIELLTKCREALK